MAKSKVNRDNYIVIQGFMLTDLNLKGNELILYACIYGFSQSEGQKFTGSLQYLADWTNSTKQGVVKSLKSLVEKGYLEKTDTVINGVKFCEYRVTKFNGVCNSVVQGMQQSLTGGMKQSLTNNIALDNIENKKEDKKEKSIDYVAIANAYKEICISFPVIRHLSEARKKAIKARINSGYTQDDFITLFRMAQESDFLKGKNDRKWSADFDWLIKDSNMAKVLDGKYANKDKPAHQFNYDYGQEGVDYL